MSKYELMNHFGYFFAFFFGIFLRAFQTTQPHFPPLKHRDFPLRHTRWNAAVSPSFPFYYYSSNNNYYFIIVLLNKLFIFILFFILLLLYNFYFIIIILFLFCYYYIPALHSSMCSTLNPGTSTVSALWQPPGRPPCNRCRRCPGRRARAPWRRATGRQCIPPTGRLAITLAPAPCWCDPEPCDHCTIPTTPWLVL